jgi:hypothetical protein
MTWRIIEKLSEYSSARKESVRATKERHPRVKPHPRQLLFAVPIDPHARIPPTDRKLVQRFALRSFTSVIPVAVATPRPSAALSIANKVYPDARNVRKQRRTFFECRRERDPFVAGEDGDVSTETKGKGDGDISVVSAHFHVESWTCAAVSVGRGGIMLFFCVRSFVLRHILFKTKVDKRIQGN